MKTALIWLTFACSALLVGQQSEPPINQPPPVTSEEVERTVRKEIRKVTEATREADKKAATREAETQRKIEKIAADQKKRQDDEDSRRKAEEAAANQIRLERNFWIICGGISVGLLILGAIALRVRKNQNGNQPTRGLEIVPNLPEDPELPELKAYAHHFPNKKRIPFIFIQRDGTRIKAEAEFKNGIENFPMVYGERFPAEGVKWDKRRQAASQSTKKSVA